MLNITGAGKNRKTRNTRIIPVIFNKNLWINMVKETKTPKICRDVGRYAPKASKVTSGHIPENTVHLQRRGQSGIICLQTLPLSGSGEKMKQRSGVYEKDPPHHGAGLGLGAAAVPVRLRLRGRQDPPQIPDLGRGPAREHAGHLRRLHPKAPRCGHRGTGHQLERVLDQAGGRSRIQHHAGYLLDAHQPDLVLFRFRHSGGCHRPL